MPAEIGIRQSVCDGLVARRMSRKDDRDSQGYDKFVLEVPPWRHGRRRRDIRDQVVVGVEAI